MGCGLSDLSRIVSYGINRVVVRLLTSTPKGLFGTTVNWNRSGPDCTRLANCADGTPSMVRSMSLCLYGKIQGLVINRGKKTGKHTTNRYN